ncbi:hypothetical protein CW706_01665, partial [Candidatus Bathyarchaeota archaeon]
MVKIYAIVRRKRKVRKGKGFSREELRSANLSVKEARNLGISVDERRSTMHEENVKTLRAFISEIQRTRIRTEKVKVAPPAKRKTLEAVISELTQVKGIGQRRAQQLVNIGINSVEKLSKMKQKELS